MRGFRPWSETTATRHVSVNVGVESAAVQLEEGAVIKGSEIVNKLLAAGMIVASMGFFSDIGHVNEYIIPGLLFGAGGFFLALRRERKAAAELELQQRVDQLAEGLAATQAEVSAAQVELERLREERDFMRQLVPSVAAPPSSPPLPNPIADHSTARGAEVPGLPR